MPNQNGDQAGQGSQDALRHEKDALHHKFHHEPRTGSPDEMNDPQSTVGQQPEIPKVGSRDAPGG